MTILTVPEIKTKFNKGDYPNEQDYIDLIDTIAAAAGYDAYEVAVGQGFSGTRQEWLDSLVGVAYATSPVTFDSETKTVALNIGTGLTTTSNNITIDSTVTTLTGSQTLTNKTINSPIIDEPVLIGPEERWLIEANAAETLVNLDVKTSSILYYTSNATGNWALNIRGDASTSLNSLLSVGDSITVVFLNTNGSTAYYQTSITVDSTSVTPKWQGGSAPSAGNASSIDAYSATIIKTAATPTYVILESQTRFS